MTHIINTSLLTTVSPPSLPPTFFSFGHKLKTGRSASLCFTVFSGIASVLCPSPRVQPHQHLRTASAPGATDRLHWEPGQGLNPFIVFHGHSSQLHISNTFYTTVAGLPGMLLGTDF